MLKKVITFTDFDGNECKKEAYFNLSKQECVALNLEFEKEGGLIGRLRKLMDEKIDGELPQKPMVDFVKMLIEKSYGVRPKDDPSAFIKFDDDGKPLANRFKQTLAYDTYVYALLSGEESLDEFAKSVLPQISDEQKAEAEKQIAEMGFGAKEPNGIKG